MVEATRDLGREPGKETSLGLGERLRSARRARALSLEQVSQMLRLEESVLEALESERFASLGAPVFVRGHLRAYARVLGLPEEAVLEAYRQADPASVQPPNVARRLEEPLTEPLSPAAIAAIVAVAILALAIFYWFTQDDVPATLPESAPAAAESSAFVPLEPTIPADAAATAAPESAPAVTPPASADATEAPGAMPAPSVRATLTLEFNAPTRVTVADRTGALMSGEQQAGTRREFAGQPPFEVAIANPSAVSFALDGRPYVPPAGVVEPGSDLIRFRIAGTQN